VVVVRSFSLNSVSLRAVLLALVIVVASVSAVFAYLHLSEDTRVRTVTAFPPYELSMELEKTVFNLGEDVNVTISIKNIGNETITVVWGSSAMFDFNVTDANGTFVFSRVRTYVFAAESIQVSLLSGEVFSAARNWDQTRTIIVGDQLLGYGIPVERGVYSIIGRLNHAGIYSGRYPDVATPPIQITIV
jgi:hypothetical protein